MRAVIYARYSSENQREASIEDQVRICKAEIGRRGFKLTQVYSDHAISGSTSLRPGYQKLLEDARSGLFDVVVAEALDRLSRDQESVAGLYKRLTFANVKLVTISEGEINELHVGLKGTMNALYLKDLAQKTFRGLEGRVRQGKSAGGRPYGYNVQRQYRDDGQPIAGLRSINPAEAAVIKRVFKLFAGGTSPRGIAGVLNAERIPAPNGGLWAETSIRGHAKRRTGLLRNDLYRGKLVWNKQRFIKDPTTGKRIARSNPETEWVWQDAPDLRIVADDLWNKVQARFTAVRADANVQKAMATRFWQQRRPKHLFSGMVKCGCCGGAFAGIGRDYLACSSARRFGTCENRISVRRADLETAVLSTLRDNLMQPDLVEEFVRAYHEEINRKASEASANLAWARKKIANLTRQIDAIIDSIAEGIKSAAMVARLELLEAEKAELERQAAYPTPTPIRLHPKLPEIYRAKVEKLAESLSAPEVRDEAAELLRGLIDEIAVRPTDAGTEVHVKGDIAKMVRFANPKIQQNQCSVKVVAGEGFEPPTNGL